MIRLSFPRLSSIHSQSGMTTARLLIAALLVMLLGSLNGCVSLNDYKDLQTAYDQARTKLDEADHELAVARAKIDELNAKIAQLNALIEASSGGGDALKKERDLLSAQLADLQKKYDDLLKQAGTPVLPAPITNALRDLASKYSDILEFDERLGMVRFKSDLTFDVGSTVVKPRAREALTTFARILNYPEIANNEVQVIGHTDDIPIRQTTAMQVNPTNWILSTNRAWAVLDVLHSAGLADSRGMACGWGDQRPIAPNAPGRRGNEKNRRVDIYIRPTVVPEGIVVSTPGAGGAPAPRRAPTPAPRTPATQPATAPGMAPFIPG